MSRSLWRVALLALVVEYLGLLTASSAVAQLRAEAQSLSQWVVSALRGNVSVTVAIALENRVRFHDILNPGDELRIHAGGAIELLLGKQVLVSAQDEATLRLSTDSASHPEVQVSTGTVRIAVSQGDQAINIRTPTATAITYGGLVLVTVASGHERTADLNRRPHTIRLVAGFRENRGVQHETLAVLEGRVQLQALTSPDPPISIEAGQGVDIVTGQIKRVVTMTPKPMPPARLCATEAHVFTPAQGIEQVVARDRSEAETLQQVLLKNLDTAEPQAGLRDIILSTSLSLPSLLQGQTQQSAPSLTGSLSGGAGPTPVFSPPTPVALNSPGIIISTSAGVQLPDSPPTSSRPQPSGSTASPPIIWPPQPVRFFDDDDDDRDEIRRGQNRGRGRGNSRDNDVDERLFKTLRTAPMALPPPAGVPAMSSAPNPNSWKS